MATNGFVAGGDMLKVSVGFVGVRETLVKLAPPPFPISPFFPPQPPRAIMAQVIVKRIEVKRIEVDRVERLTIQGSCKRDKIPAFKLTSRCFKMLQTKLLQTWHSKLDATFRPQNQHQAVSLSSLREFSSPWA